MHTTSSSSSVTPHTVTFADLANTDNSRDLSSSEDLSRYLHLNGSQDSFAHQCTSVPSTPKATKPAATAAPSILEVPTCMAMGHSQSEPGYVNESPVSDTSAAVVDTPVYNEYGNPDLFARSSFPDSFYPARRYSESMQRRSTAPLEAVNPNQIQVQQQQQKLASDENSQYSGMDDEVMLVPQDDYMFDQTDSQYYPDILQFDLGDGKPLPHSNDLNIFKSDDVCLADEISEDDDDDAMDTDVDDISSESSVDNGYSLNVKNSSLPVVPTLQSERVITKAPVKKQRKPRQVRKPRKAKMESSGKNDKTEEHICLIINPKTGLPCNKRFSRPYDLVRHQNTIHAPRRCFYRCMFCEDDLRRKHHLASNNEVVINAGYRNSQFSVENANNNMANSHNSRKVKASSEGGGFLSNKTFSRCDALTRHLRFRHGLGNEEVNAAMEYAKQNVEYYDN